MLPKSPNDEYGLKSIETILQNGDMLIHFRPSHCRLIVVASVVHSTEM